MRLLMLGLATLALTGCVVASYDPSDYRYVPYIQTFQKAGQQGHTNTAQRKVDMQSCGVDKANVDDLTWNTGRALSGETLQQIVTRSKKLNSCMESKGYIAYTYDDCGPLKAPTGLCN